MIRMARYFFLLIMLSGATYAQKGIDVSRFQDSIDFIPVDVNFNPGCVE